jgi:hypothetical protein
MSYQKILALNSKLCSLNQDKRAYLFSYLPEQTRLQLEANEALKDPILLSFTMEKLSRRIEPSHLKDFLAQLPSSEKIFFIKAFPPYKQIQLSDEKIEVSSFLTHSFSEHVLFILFQKALKHFPPSLILPKHKLTELLGDTGVPLSKLVYFLGFFDLVKEVKIIISQKTLKALQESFNKEELAFINKVGNEDRVRALSLMNLRMYNGDKKKLKELILERGIYRFSQGIKNLPSPYLFYLTYFLPKDISDKVDVLLKEKEQYAKGYFNWEDDILTTWRFLCTYSK